MLRSEVGPVDIKDVSVKGITSLHAEYRKRDDCIWFVYVSGGIAEEYDIPDDAEISVSFEALQDMVYIPIRVVD